MGNQETLMRQEAREAGSVVGRQRLENAALMQQLGALLRARPPRLVITCARGSSDHAASFAKYAIETRAGVLVASHAPSTSSIYGTAFSGLEGALFLAISQSGKSPDILASIVAAKEAGAIVVAMVNDENSPAADLADLVIPLRAGLERSVAATKSYVASVMAIAHLVAEWTGDRGLDSALDRAEDHINAAFEQDWGVASEVFAPAQSLFVIGRGLTFGVAHEAALKLKETSALHAEAFSAAEVRHGPMAIVEKDFPVLILQPEDPTKASFPALSGEFAARGAKVFASGDILPGAIMLPTATGLHPLIAPACQITSFYAFAEKLALARGRNPDDPPWLRKVTETR
ncbi:MAG: SIS domain-containing protein [Hyphomonadaceae bacterium]|nr:SIS domain-containing protein [Hyphomonadaceae bacterium]